MSDQPRAGDVDYLLMNDDATVTPLTRCDDCGFLFRDIEKHVAESVTVRAEEGLITDHGFAWIGQSMNGCETCGKPLWEHEGVQVLKPGAGPFGKGNTEIVSPQEAARRMPLFGHYAGIKADA